MKCTNCGFEPPQEEIERPKWERPMKKRGLVTYEQLESYGASGLSWKDIATACNVTDKTLCVWREDDPMIEQVVHQGRVKALLQCAKVVLDNAVKLNDPKIALEYLKRMSNNWADKPQNMTLIQTGDGQTITQLPQLDEGIMTRMSLVFLKRRGYTIIEPEGVIEMEAQQTTPQISRTE